MTNSEKLKAPLEKKEIECNHKIKNLNKTWMIIKAISITTSV